MDLRQKILFASQEADSSLKYDPALVQSLFMHTVLSGIQSNNIKSDPHVQTNTSDELLLEKLNMACGNEKERQDKKKHAAPSCVTNVSTVQSSEPPVEKKRTIPQHTATLPPDLLSEIKEMRSDMALHTCAPTISPAKQRTSKYVCPISSVLAPTVPTL
ncbi:hypothetical protein F2P81_002603 [Scophthalmus maximus]|uniref:Uncharacterized protein n=1 Tax=Scophthalmus maximus TaxID=52904 RepID=A0A6A4TS62_SCOMX|nr:hypothetical protein F2P81_002603 [Scophthalmus maximus]